MSPIQISRKAELEKLAQKVYSRSAFIMRARLGWGIYNYGIEVAWWHGDLSKGRELLQAKAKTIGVNVVGL